MGRYYSGDIEGKFWFAVQSSDDASFFGGSDEDNEEEGTIDYFFQAGDLDDIEFGLEECRKNLGEYHTKLDAFFEAHNGYNNAMVSKELKIGESKVRELLEWYARYELGTKIRDCVKEKGECNFSAET